MLDLVMSHRAEKENIVESRALFIQTPPPPPHFFFSIPPPLSFFSIG